ncbi:hypothetical protein IID10_10390 [candidate division KSB1 bacterium]|nr:hypothetical protein [candidate division KSB1 bacterium]
MSAAHWEEIDQYHPQSSMKLLLEELGVSREQVTIFSDNSDDSNARITLLSEVMRSSGTTNE